MKIEEAIEYMSSLYLERILRSYTQDYPKKGEEEYRNLIKNNVDTLSDPKKIKNRLDSYFFNNRDPYSKQILYSLILKSLLSKNDYFETSEKIIENVTAAEKNIIELSKNSDSFKHIDNESINILCAILEVALKDQIISKDELALVVKLRKKLSLNEKDQYLIQAKLNLFPSTQNRVHSHSEISSVIDDLQKCGVLFCCNQHNEIKETIFVIPEEIIPGLKKVLDIELIEDKYKLMLDKFQKKQLKSVLVSTNFHQSGIKEDLIIRIIQTGIKPSEALEILSSNELSDICDRLPGLIKSGTKDEKIDRIIDYFSNLIIKQVNKDEDPREKYYEYLEELAARDLNNLLGNNIIKNPHEIEQRFEEGTRYLFEKKFKHKLIKFDNKECADGGTIFQDTNNLLLWDNKSKLDGNSYKFPDAHFRQFRRYIRNESAKGRRVSCFLIIASKIDTASKKNAIRLKAESGQDTDVALISAENLKMVAEDWQNHSKKEKFNLHILNDTGILERDILKERMNWHK